MRQRVSVCLLSLGWLCSVITLPSIADDQQSSRLFSQKVETAPTTGRASAQTDQSWPKSWIADGPAPVWIWGADASQKYVARKVFTGTTKAARLKTSCDNVVTLRINGQQVLQSSNWQETAEADIQKYIKAGENVLEAEISNEGGVAAFLLKLALVSPDGKTEYVVSDDTWQIAPSANAKTWDKPRVVAKYGVAPWGEVLSGGADSSRDLFNVLPGFQVERIFTVPKDKLGSWVCLAVDAKGRILASDQRQHRHLPHYAGAGWQRAGVESGTARSQDRRQTGLRSTRHALGV